MSNLNQFTEAELETIAAAMDDYIHYDDENANEDELIGGLSVNDRVYSINQKINNLRTGMRTLFLTSSLEFYHLWVKLRPKE